MSEIATDQTGKNRDGIFRRISDIASKGGRHDVRQDNGQEHIFHPTRDVFLSCIPRFRTIEPSLDHAELRKENHDGRTRLILCFLLAEGRALELYIKGNHCIFGLGDQLSSS